MALWKPNRTVRTALIRLRVNPLHKAVSVPDLGPETAVHHDLSSIDSFVVAGRVDPLGSSDLAPTVKTVKSIILHRYTTPRSTQPQLKPCL